MVRCTLRNKVAPTALTMCLVFGIIFPLGCKKKEQPQVSGQKAPPETARPVPAADRVYQADTAEKINLRVLYAGVPNSERAKDFVDFLAKHFEQVETADYKVFKEDQASGFDVVILDASRLNISREYSRATITVGVPGAGICSSLSLKTGYL